MKDFKHWGIKIRKNEKLNYYSIWYNLKTIRLDLGDTVELPCDWSEFYDVGLGTKCNAECPFCYVSALKGGEFWDSPCETWKNWINTIEPDKDVEFDETIKDLLFEKILDEDSPEVVGLKYLFRSIPVEDMHISNKPLQIAIGSTGEPTIHPDICKFLETVYNTGVVPNYTTNGIVLSEMSNKGCKKLMEATSKYCGGVAVSYGNKQLRKQARKAIYNLIRYGNCKVMIHHLISDRDSVDEVVKLSNFYGSEVHYHVLLPLMEHGRSNEGMKEGVFEYLAEKINTDQITNVALGANFTPELKKHPGLIDIYEYPQETYSKNMLLKKKNEVTITPSSYDLKPMKVINL